MQVQEVVRRWQAGESARAIARALHLGRGTVGRYIGEARRLGLSLGGPPTTEEELLQLVRYAHRGLAHPRPQPSSAHLEALAPRIQAWIDQGFQLTCIYELLGRDAAVSYSSLRRFAARRGLRKQAVQTTVSMAPTAPGELAEMDFGRLGWLV